MTYIAGMTIDIYELTAFNAVDKEISRIAAKAYDEKGASLYDGIRLTSADHPSITEYAHHSIYLATQRLWDCAFLMRHCAYRWEALDGDVLYTTTKQPSTTDVLFEDGGEDSTKTIETGYANSKIVVDMEDASHTTKDYAEKGSVFHLYFILPDFETERLEELKETFGRYITYYASARWFAQRHVERKEEYMKKADEYLAQIVEMAKTRQPIKQNMTW